MAQTQQAVEASPGTDTAGLASAKQPTQATPGAGPGTRLAQLDGLRAIAILAVVAFHFCQKSSVYGEGVTLPDTGLLQPFTQFGRYGVPLFFIISGFVIFLTLERCRGRIEFAIRRFARLWPALVLCCVLTFVVVNLLVGDTGLGRPLVSFIPSITLLPPEVWHGAGIDSASWVSESLWSLSAEVSFYIIAALVYFRNPANFLKNLMYVALALISFKLIALVGAGAQADGSIDAPGVLNVFVLPHYIFYFLFGAALFNLYRRRDMRLSLLVAGSALVLQIWNSTILDPQRRGSPFLTTVLVVCIVAGLFTAALFLPVVARACSWRPLLVLGRSSYSTYLIHQMIGVALIVVLLRWTGWSGGLPYIIIGAAVVAMFALGYGLQRLWESPAQRFVLSRALRRTPSEQPNAVTPLPVVATVPA